MLITHFIGRMYLCDNVMMFDTKVFLAINHGMEKKKWDFDGVENVLRDLVGDPIYAGNHDYFP